MGSVIVGIIVVAIIAAIVLSMRSDRKKGKHSCGGTCGEAKRAVYAGQCYGDLPTAAKDGWTFDGWYTAPEGGSRIDGADIVTAGDHTLYAHYSREYSYVFYNYRRGGDPRTRPDPVPPVRRHVLLCLHRLERLQRGHDHLRQRLLHRGV